LRESFLIDSSHRIAVAKRIRKEYDMKFLVLSIGAVVAALSLTYGLAIASASSSSTSAAKVGTASSNLGRILVDSHGRTLYLFAKDRHGKSTCYGLCAGYWPALTTKGKPKAISGVRAALLGTTRRKDGRLQVTYRGHPLYRFSGDSSASKTSGEGLTDFGGAWWAVSPAGNKIVSGATGPGY
jgi:predicted lipoprotein with Yx(FWY)xxD motif